MKKAAIVLMLVSIGMVAAFGGIAEASPTSAIVFNGQAHLNGGFPCTGCPGTFDGVARGVALNPNVICTACPMTANYTYNEPGGQCVANIPAAPLGSAQGSYTVTGPTASITGNFGWTRVGVTAVMVLSAPLGVGLAGFVPPATCAPTNATVAGIALTV